jgi:fructose-1,6-bisphosphatase/inositol monophosphatase family enzyme
VEEAGGRVTRFDGSPFTCRGGQVVASNGRIHESMITAIRDFDASRRSRNWTG